MTRQAVIDLGDQVDEHPRSEFHIRVDHIKDGYNTCLKTSGSP